MTYLFCNCNSILLSAARLKSNINFILEYFVNIDETSHDDKFKLKFPWKIVEIVFWIHLFYPQMICKRKRRKEVRRAIIIMIFVLKRPYTSESAWPKRLGSVSEGNLSASEHSVLAVRNNFDNSSGWLRVERLWRKKKTVRMSN